MDNRRDVVAHRILQTIGLGVVLFSLFQRWFYAIEGYSFITFIIRFGELVEKFKMDNDQIIMSAVITVFIILGSRY